MKELLLINESPVFGSFSLFLPCFYAELVSSPVKTNKGPLFDCTCWRVPLTVDVNMFCLEKLCQLLCQNPARTTVCTISLIDVKRCSFAAFAPSDESKSKQTEGSSLVHTSHPLIDGVTECQPSIVQCFQKITIKVKLEFSCLRFGGDKRLLAISTQTKASKFWRTMQDVSWKKSHNFFCALNVYLSLFYLNQSGLLGSFIVHNI